MVRTMTTFLLAALLLSGTACSGGNKKTKVLGVGSSFVDPLAKKWASDYGGRDSNVVVEYQGQGSGAGIQQFIKGTITFGATDVPMSKKEIEEASDDVYHLPVTAGAIVVAYNLPGCDDIKLTRKTLTGIFLGEITKWNDDHIAAANPNLKGNLPNKPITVVTRSDGSGTTAAFTLHLAAVSPEFKEKIGTGKKVEWPKSFLGAPQNAGVASQIQQNEGALGYVEYGYAAKSETKMQMATLENKAGQFIKPSFESASAVLAGTELPPDMTLTFPDPAGAKDYPVVTYTWFLAQKKYTDAKVGAAVKEFFKFCLNDGQKFSEELGYVPLPEKVTKKVLETIDKIQ